MVACKCMWAENSMIMKIIIHKLLCTRFALIHGIHNVGAAYIYIFNTYTADNFDHEPFHSLKTFL